VDDATLRSLVILSQDVHRIFGGVVPEIASRAHLTAIVPVVEAALAEAGATDVDAVAVTNAPGLVGALLVGVSYAKALAFARGVPVIGVHHMEGHLFATALEHRDAVPPFTALLVSGGHTMLLDVEAWGRYRLLGRTRDDAAGEAFDKVAKLLGLPYPGGPHVEQLAATSDGGAFRFARPMVRRDQAPTDPDFYDVSFSGLKTAVLNAVKSSASLDDDRAAIARAFQDSLIDTLVEENDASRASVQPNARRARRRRGVQRRARERHARTSRGSRRAHFHAVAAIRDGQCRNDRAGRTLSSRARRTVRARAQCIRFTATSRTGRRMILASSPIVHHPFQFTIAGFTLTGFGLAVLLAFLISQVIAERELARRGHDIEAVGVSDVLFAALVGTMIGAKFYYVIVVSHNIRDLWSRGGFVFWGGFIGSVLLCAATIRFKKLSFVRFADVSGIAIAAGYSIGRTGCWAVGDDYGKPYSGFLAVAFPQGSPPSTVQEMVATFHITPPVGSNPGDVLSVVPTQLIEVLLGAVMFGILWRIRDHKHAEGWLFGAWAVLAGVERFIVEFFRAKDDRLGWTMGLSVAQIIAIAIVLVGVVVMRMRRETGPGRPGIHALVSSRA